MEAAQVLATRAFMLAATSGQSNSSLSGATLRQL
jgi:hypothetical protein